MVTVGREKNQTNKTRTKNTSKLCILKNMSRPELSVVKGTHLLAQCHCKLCFYSLNIGSKCQQSIKQRMQLNNIEWKLLGFTFTGDTRSNIDIHTVQHWITYDPKFDKVLPNVGSNYPIHIVDICQHWPCTLYPIEWWMVLWRHGQWRDQHKQTNKQNRKEGKGVKSLKK